MQIEMKQNKPAIGKRITGTAPALIQDTIGIIWYWIRSKFKRYKKKSDK